MLENFFTLPKDEFGKLLLSQVPTNTIQNKPQAYRYTRVRLLKCAMEAGPLISFIAVKFFCHAIPAGLRRSPPSRIWSL